MKKLICTVALCALPMMAMAAPKYAAQVNHFALKKNQNWTWANLAKTPKVKWQNKTPKKNYSGMYEITGSISKYGTLTAYGSRSMPEMIHISSSQLYRESENGKDVYKINQLFDKKELKEVKSNCTIPEESDDFIHLYQKFYVWKKAGYEPLYVFEMGDEAGTASGGIMRDYFITKDFSNFNNEYTGITMSNGFGAEHSTCSI